MYAEAERVIRRPAACNELKTPRAHQPRLFIREATPRATFARCAAFEPNCPTCPAPSAAARCESGSRSGCGSPSRGRSPWELLKHRSARVRAVAAAAFGRVATAGEAPKLLPLLEDADPRVALAALDAALTLAIEAPGVLLPAVAALLPRLTGEARYSALTGVRGVLMEEPALAAKLSLVPAVLQRCCESKDSDDQNAGFAALGVLRPAGLARVEALLAKLERSADPMIKESARAIRTPEE